jgi:hypothetical protein
VHHGDRHGRRRDSPCSQREASVFNRLHTKAQQAQVLSSFASREESSSFEELERLTFRMSNVDEKDQQ